MMQGDELEQDFDRLFIFGAGGSGRETAWLAEQRWGQGVSPFFVVSDKSYLSAPVNQVPVILINEISAGPRDRFIVALGDAALRREAVIALKNIGLQPATLVHPRAEISRFSQIGEGTIVCAGSIIGTNVEIGCYVQLNVGCTISHDVLIGDYATLSPGVHVSGHVEIGNDVFLGTGASVINGRSGLPLRIGSDAIVAAGACVIRPVDQRALVAGVPAVQKR